MFSDLDQPNKQVEVTANWLLRCDLGKTCVCKCLVLPAAWAPPGSSRVGATPTCDLIILFSLEKVGTGCTAAR